MTAEEVRLLAVGDRVFWESRPGDYEDGVRWQSGKFFMVEGGLIRIQWDRGGVIVTGCNGSNWWRDRLRRQ